MKKVLLIGANGLVGKSFNLLYADTFEIIPVGSQHAHQIESYLADNIDTVIFCAQSKDYKEPVVTQNLFDVNVALLHSTLLAAAGKCSRFIYFSTGSVYDFKQADGTVNEATPLNINSGNPYVASKLMGEELVHAFSKNFDAALILRPFFIYGEHQKDNMLFSVMRNKINSGETIELASGKGLIFNPVYVSDVCLFLKDWINEAPEKKLETVNLFGQDTTSLSAVVDSMSLLLKKTPAVKLTDSQPGKMIATTITGRNFGHTKLQEGIGNFLKV